MTGSKLTATLAVMLLAAACVTINVYFPEAAAERAADRIIDDVWGAPAQEEKTNDKSGSKILADPGGLVRLAGAILDVLIPAAHASADLDIDTPQIRSLTASMNARHAQLRAFYDAGAIGLTRDATVEFRDRSLIPLAQRNAARELVDAENKDRAELYRAIAEANSHPEWLEDIRRTFAERWVSKAAPGWYYRDANGGWAQK